MYVENKSSSDPISSRLAVDDPPVNGSDGERSIMSSGKRNVRSECARRWWEGTLVVRGKSEGLAVVAAAVEGGGGGGGGN